MIRTTIWVLPWTTSYSWALTEKEVSVYAVRNKPFPIVVETHKPVQKFMFGNWMDILMCVPLDYYPILLPYLSADPLAAKLHEAAYKTFCDRTV